MGRKRGRRRASIDYESGDSDADLETIVVDKKDYSLRPRSNRASLFTQDLIEDEENEHQSDFEDELGSETLVTTVRHEANQERCVDYEDGASDGKNLIDFESFIDKTEIQVHKRKIQEIVPSDVDEEKPKRRGRKSKWMEEGNDGNAAFYHFLDTRDTNVEDMIEIAPCLDYMNDANEQEIAFESRQLQENIDALTPVPEVKQELNETEEIALQSLIETSEVDLVKNEPLEDVEAFVKHSPLSEIDYVDVNESHQFDNIEPVIDNAGGELSVHSWSGITAAMSDKSCFLETDGEVAILRENAPKARYHYLIIPKENLKGLNELNAKHISVVEHMFNTAKRVVEYPHHKNFQFLIGFNALPSMIMYEQKFCWLHLHVISDDVNFDNVALRKHWNAMHSSLFIHPEGRNFARITNVV